MNAKDNCHPPAGKRKEKRVQNIQILHPRNLIPPKVLA
jgi:hypothetical protein